MSNRKLHMWFRAYSPFWHQNRWLSMTLNCYKLEFSENFAGFRRFGMQQQLNDSVVTHWNVVFHIMLLPLIWRRFLLQEPSYTHCCRALTLALARLSCMSNCNSFCASAVLAYIHNSNRVSESLRLRWKETVLVEITALQSNSLRSSVSVADV